MSNIGQRVSAALIAAQSEMPLIRKSGMNSRFGYSYAQLEDYVAGIQAILARHELCTVTSVMAVLPLPERKLGSQSQHAVQVQVRLTLVHSSGESVEVMCYGEGQDSGDKAIYKAITGARKYGLACLLGLATSDDPELEAEDRPPIAEMTPIAPPTSLAAKRDSAMRFFEEKGIPLSTVEGWIGKPKSQWSREDLIELSRRKSE